MVAACASGGAFRALSAAFGLGWGFLVLSAACASGVANLFLEFLFQLQSIIKQSYCLPGSCLCFRLGLSCSVSSFFILPFFISHSCSTCCHPLSTSSWRMIFQQIWVGFLVFGVLVPQPVVFLSFFITAVLSWDWQEFLNSALEFKKSFLSITSCLFCWWLKICGVGRSSWG